MKIKIIRKNKETIIHLDRILRNLKKFFKNLSFALGFFLLIVIAGSEPNPSLNLLQIALLYIGTISASLMLMYIGKD